MRSSAAAQDARLRASAPIFAALGDETRLALVARLSKSPGEPLSIARLTGQTALTRQAVTKHLRVLEGAGIVRGARQGRETLFELEPKNLEEARRCLDHMSRAWDATLGRLNSMSGERAQRRLGITPRSGSV